MSEMPETHDDEVVEIEFPDRDTVAAFTSAVPYINLSLAVLDNVTHTVGLNTRAHPESSETTTYRACEPLNRDEAILRGHLVRLVKIFRTVRDEVKAKRGDWLPLFGRLAAETCVNLRCLLRNKKFDEYVLHSFRAELALLDEISRRLAIEKRAPEPMELRMRASIAKTFLAGGITEQAARAGKLPRDLFGMTFEERLQFLGLGEKKKDRASYIGVYSIPSHSIHGSWEDLRINHVYFTDSGDFEPDLSPALIEPGQLLVPAWMALAAVEEFVAAQRYSGKFAQAIEGRIEEDRERIFVVLDCWDEFRGSPT